MGTTLPVRRAPRSLLFVAALLGSAAACTTDADCHLNGACVGGACACSPGWSDAACGTLMLAPLDPANGFNHLFESDGNVSTTWGGRALPGDGDGKFHAFFAFMLNHCSIANYSSNSVCMHGVGDLALGPFAVGDIVLGAFCHNPMIERGPNGEWLLFHIGSGGRTPVDCGRGAARAGGAGGSSSTEGAARGGGASAPGGWADVHVMSASSPYGPWTSTPDIIRNGADGEWDSGGVTNPAPLRLPNGSFLLGYRGRNATGGERLGIASAPSWRGPYTKLTTGPITAVNSEDPFLWMDARGNLHMLYHAFDEGGHVFSPAGQPTVWTTQSYHPYNRTVHFVNGTVRTMPRRERPQLYLDATLTPRVLYTGLVVSGTSVYNPAFTSAQGVIVD